jgi:hypothetical protein
MTSILSIRQRIVAAGLVAMLAAVGCATTEPKSEQTTSSAVTQGLQGSGKTTTLANGEVIPDLNGDWNVVQELYGRLGEGGTTSGVYRITQKGSSFSAIRTAAAGLAPAGSEAARGELDKGGFKNAWIVVSVGPQDAKGRMSADGNSFVLEDGRSAKQTYTRR